MKKGFAWLLLTTIFLILTGCSEKKEIPQGFSEQSYTDFAKIYSDYQEAKKENKKYQEGLSIAGKYQDKHEKGERELSAQELKVNDALGDLLLYYNNRISLDHNELDNQPDVKAVAILLAEKENKIPVLENIIEETLELPKTNKKETKKTDSEEKANNTDTDKKDNPTDNISAENCPQPYTKEDCEKFKDYYTDGEGQFESDNNK